MRWNFSMYEIFMKNDFNFSLLRSMNEANTIPMDSITFAAIQQIDTANYRDCLFTRIFQFITSNEVMNSPKPLEHRFGSSKCAIVDILYYNFRRRQRLALSFCFLLKFQFQSLKFQAQSLKVVNQLKYENQQFCSFVYISFIYCVGFCNFFCFHFPESNFKLIWQRLVLDSEYVHTNFDRLVLGIEEK